MVNIYVCSSGITTPSFPYTRSSLRVVSSLHLEMTAHNSSTPLVPILWQLLIDWEKETLITFGIFLYWKLFLFTVSISKGSLVFSSSRFPQTAISYHSSSIHSLLEYIFEIRKIDMKISVFARLAFTLYIERKSLADWRKEV